MKKGGLEGWRLLGRHFLYILTAACIVVTGWTFMVNPTTGLPTLFSFVGLLIPTWLLSGQEAVYDGSFWDLSPGAVSYTHLTLPTNREV